MAQNAALSGRAEPRRLPSLLLVLLAISVALNLALLALVGMRGLNFPGSSAASATSFSKDSYYAVFLNNKEAFVGHITDLSGNTINMSSLYYLTFDPPKDDKGQPIPNASPNDYKPALKKLGQEVWGPKDAVQINRQNMEYYTELRTDSPIVKAIIAFNTPKK
ncbi:MAG: hypothetical protein NVSMB17_14920 [Candidatus Dormibacteria bacterium]